MLIDAGTRPNALGAASLPELSLLTQAPDAVLLTYAHSNNKRYSPKRVVLVHGEVGSRQAFGSLLKKSAHVD